MNADTYRTLAVVFLALAVILAAVAVVLYRKLDIPAVRDALSGRTAEREIAQLRGTRRGAWRYADEFGEGKGRRGRGHGGVRSDTTGNTHDTSDIEFRAETGSGSGAASGSFGSRSTDAGLTRPAANQSAPAKTDDVAVEIPVSMASAAELADEGETSLMQFRNTERKSGDDDESRTILVHGGKKQ